MLIVCPTCASQYRIEAAHVGPEGRSVRCAACRETWFVTPPDAPAAGPDALDAAFPGAPPDAAAADAATDAAWAEASAAVRNASGGAVLDNVPPRPRPTRPRKPQPRPGRPRPVLARLRAAGFPPAVAAGLALLAALPLAGLARAAVVRAVPQTAGLYASLGLPVNLRGLEIRDVVAYRNPAGGDRPAELVVEGDLVGLGPGNTPVPVLTVEVRNGAERALRSFPVPAPRAALAEGETARFRASLPEPPDLGRSLEVRFGGAGGR